MSDQPPITHLAVRENGGNPDHHIYDNNGTLWVQFTVHRGPTLDRIRRSLKTADIAVARAKRDRLFRCLRDAAGRGRA